MAHIAHHQIEPKPISTILRKDWMELDYVHKLKANLKVNPRHIARCFYYQFTPSVSPTPETWISGEVSRNLFP